MPLRLVTRAWHRIYADFLLPSRLQGYEALLSRVLERGYTCVPIGEFWELIREQRVEPETNYFILRHDVDTDLRTAQAMWEIEERLGVRGSWYFRLGTLDLSLIERIAEHGSEASYHFEELATVAKKRGLHDRRGLDAAMVEIQELFAQNLDRVRRITGLPMDVVASHGDFANRRLGVPNHVLLADAALRGRTGVTLEVYDDDFMRHVGSRHSDTAPPAYWVPSGPLDAVEAGVSVVYVLVHPRYWRADPFGNALENLRRLGEGLEYTIRRITATDNNHNKARRALKWP